VNCIVSKNLGAKLNKYTFVGSEKIVEYYFSSSLSEMFLSKKYYLFRDNLFLTRALG
jgi:hypothetical protein